MMKRTALLLAGTVFVMSGCASVDAGIDRAAEAKRQSNDAQAKVWVLAGCDLSLAAVRRADMAPELRAALLNFCLGESAPDGDVSD